MAKVAENIILIWSGTNAAIPSGYTRETTLDGKYPKGAASSADGGDTGGAATHTHTSSGTHTHTLDGHEHTITFGTGTGGGRNTGTSAQNAISTAHTHASIATTGTSGGGLSAVSVTYASVANDPPYYEVIFIKSDGTAQVPDDVIALYDKTNIPSGWGLCDGTSGSPDLTDRYLRGASAGGNAGGTGGSTTNIHALTHTHTVSTHTHTNGASAAGSGTSLATQSGSELAAKTHTHTPSLDAATDTVSTASVTCTETVEPSYKKLIAIQNQSGSESLPLGIIGLWIGTLASIPAGWEVVTSMQGYHLKLGTSVQIGDTGGSNTHTHTDDSHTHTGSHDHTANNVTHTAAYGTSGTSTGAATGTPYGSVTYHTVSASTVATTYSSATTSADSSSNEPPYVTAIFLRFNGAVNITESVGVAESINQTLVDNAAVSDSVTVAEYSDFSVHAGGTRTISIWKENIFVEESIDFPGPRDFQLFNESVGVGERITVRIVDAEDTSHKPRFDVSI